MAILRTGLYGSYYGSTSSSSRALSASEMQVNAKYIFSYLSNEGWSVNAIMALLGNMQAESSLNPGRWQSDDVGNTSLGYGLVQWTPSTKYSNWCSEQGLNDPSEMDNNLKRILYELENNIQWIATNSYNFSFKEFSTSSNKTIRALAKAFLLCYERPADQSESVQNYRADLAEDWFRYLKGETPDNPSGAISRKRKGYKFLLFNANRRRQQWTKN